LPETTESIIDVLFSALGDPDDQIKQRALVAVGNLKIKTPTVVQKVLEMLDEEDNKYVRVRAIEYLRKIESREQVVIDSLLSSLMDRTWDVREKSAEVLGILNLRDEHIIEKLTQIRKLEKNETVRMQLLSALENIGIQTPELSQTLFDILNSSEEHHSNLKIQAAHTILKFGGENEEVIERVLQLFESSANDWVREMAALILGNMLKKNKKVIDVLAKSLITDLSDSVRFQIAESLIRIENLRE